MTRVRRARPGDEDGVAEVHVRSWQAAYRGLLPDAYLDGLDRAVRAERYTFDADDPVTMVAVDGKTVCGFATFGSTRDADLPRAGELWAIYVHPSWWDRGVGRELIADARRQLAARGHKSGLLWVLAGNTRAERFYRLDGWQADGARRREEIHGIEVDELRYVRNLP